MLASLIRFSIRYYGVVIAIATLILLVGGYRFATAGLDIFPEFSPKQVIIQTESPGFSSEQVELLVTQQIEMAVSGVMGSQSLRSIDWTDFEPAPVRAAPTSGEIADCAEFTIRRVVLGAGERVHLRAGEQARIVSVVGGAVRVTGEGNGGSRPPHGQRLARGDNALAPYAGAFTLSAEVTTILLLTENFSEHA